MKQKVLNAIESALRSSIPLEARTVKSSDIPHYTGYETIFDGDVRYFSIDGKHIKIAVMEGL